jgi:hypothetical protein
MSSYEFIASLRVTAGDQEEARRLAESLVAKVSRNPGTRMVLGPLTEGLAVDDERVGFALAAFPRYADDSIGEGVASVFDRSLAVCLVTAATDIEAWLPPQRQVDEGEVPIALELVLTWHGGIELDRESRQSNRGEKG